MLPYILGQIHHVHRRFGFWRNKGYDGLIDLAREHQWLELWSALLRTAATPLAYSKEVRELVLDQRLPPDEVRRRLLLLAGVGREYNFRGLGLAQVKQLEDDNAVTLYERSPSSSAAPSAPTSPASTPSSPSARSRPTTRTSSITWRAGSSCTT